MHVLITGAAGMVGRKLAEALLKAGEINGTGIDRLSVADVITPGPATVAGRVETTTADLSAPGAGRPFRRSDPKGTVCPCRRLKNSCSGLARTALARTA